MRSNLKPINQLLMCMSKSQPGDCYPTPVPSTDKIEQYPVCSSESSRASCDENETISFGPIKVKPRKKPAPTLATGRRSKYEILSAEEEEKRNVRRARNRAAAERVRISRLNVEQQLLNQINALEKQEEQLMQNVQTLQHKRLHLETRVLTHEQMCSNMVIQKPSMTSEIVVTPYLILENIPTSSQEYDAAINDKISDFDFDEFLINPFNNEQLSENFHESLTTMLINDDLNIFMDS